MKERGLTSLLLLGFQFSIRSSVNTSLEDLVLALKLILKLVFKLAHLSVLHVHVHGLRAVAALEGGSLLLVDSRSLGHRVVYICVPTK